MLILYAENDFEDFEFFVKAIKSIDPTIECINVCDGTEALEFLESNIIPDTIFLDINMPGMDGKTCLKIIRQVDALKSVPIVMYTASTEKRNEEHCLQLGATAYIQKSYSLTEAVERLRQFVEK